MNDPKPSFKQAMNVTILWCNSWEKDELSDEVLADRIGELLKTIEGARGFFVVSLSIDCPLMDRLPEPLIFQLRNSGQIVVDLTVKNLAMSSAMVIEHQKNNNSQQMQSERIRTRCIELLKLLDSNKVKTRLEMLLEGTKGNGKDLEFLNRWGYSNEQRKAISQSIYEVALT